MLCVHTSGVVCYVLTILTALHGETPTHFRIALLSVGVGWNFLYTAGSAMVHRPPYQLNLPIDFALAAAQSARCPLRPVSFSLSLSLSPCL